MESQTIILLFIILGLIYKWDWITIKTNWIVFLTIKRGILSTDCGWFKLSDLESDASGINVYYDIKSKHKIRATNILGRELHIVTDIDFISQILTQSPVVFGVGSFKYDFFKTFMKLNVGVSEGCPWKRRREFNTQVLDTNTIPRFLPNYSIIIRQLLKNGIPQTFEEFSLFGKQITMKIVFGTSENYQPVWDILSASNSLLGVLRGKTTIPEQLKDNYYTYIKKNLDNPIPGSLISLIGQSNHCLTTEEIIHQVPHWIFPIAGTISNTFPRFLALLHNKYSRSEIETILKSQSSLRKCILELFRLNNPVNSTFRSLLQDYAFDDTHSYKKGAQFLIINNPVLRDPTIFPSPNSYEPARWSDSLENSPYSIMFNHGPQNCPGKEFIINLLSVLTIEYFHSLSGIEFNIQPSLDINTVPQVINPCIIRVVLKNISQCSKS